MLEALEKCESPRRRGGDSRALPRGLTSGAGRENAERVCPLRVAKVYERVAHREWICPRCDGKHRRN